MSDRRLCKIAANPMPRNLLPLVAIAGVLGAVAVATRPQPSAATLLPSAQRPVATAPEAAEERPKQVLASVELATMRIDWISEECPLLLAVYDRHGRAIGLYEHLEHAMASHPEIHAAFLLGAFEGLPLGEADL